MIGLCVATFPATKHGQLHYRTVERFKVKTLVLCGGKWNKKVRLSHKCHYEIIWWMNNITTSKFKRFLAEKQVDHELSTDSSKTGWGCCLNEKETANGNIQQTMSMNLLTQKNYWQYFMLSDVFVADYKTQRSSF